MFKAIRKLRGAHLKFLEMSFHRVACSAKNASRLSAFMAVVANWLHFCEWPTANCAGVALRANRFGCEFWGKSSSAPALIGKTLRPSLWVSPLEFIKLFGSRLRLVCGSVVSAFFDSIRCGIGNSPALFDVISGRISPAVRSLSFDVFCPPFAVIGEVFSPFLWGAFRFNFFGFRHRKTLATRITRSLT